MTLFSYMRNNNKASFYAAVGLCTALLAVLIFGFSGTGVLAILVLPYISGLLIEIVTRYNKDSERDLLSLRAMQTSGEYYLYYYLKVFNV